MKGLRKIIAGGIILAGLTSLVGCKDKEKDEPKSEVKNLNYASSIKVNSTQGYAGAISLATGDIDDDRINELVVGDLSTVKIYKNYSHGDFQNGRLIVKPHSLAGYSQAIAVALDDVDKDGDLDLIIGDMNGVAILYNDGKGNFSQKP